MSNTTGVTFEAGSAYPSTESVITQSVLVEERARKKELTLTPHLYLIFEVQNEGAVDGGKMSLIEQITEFEKKTKLPCHIIGQTVLFHSVDAHSTCPTSDLPIKKGFNSVDLKGTNFEHVEDEIYNFMKMATLAMGKELVPVIIRLHNSEMKTKLQKRITPFICIKKNTKDVSIVWSTAENDEGEVEYKADITKPWQVKKSKTQPDEMLDNICNLNEFRGDLVTLICHLIVGVCLEENNSTMKHYEEYHTALSMFLLKKGDWTISKLNMTRPFNQKSLEYIYEKRVTSELIKFLWINQTSFSKMRYKRPEYELEDDGSKAEEKSIKLINWNSECYGLIFIALLQTKCWDGALQLLENGYIGIHHILVGCVILKDEFNDGKTEKLLKEKLKRLEKALTDKAISITSYIYEADKEKEDDFEKQDQDHKVELKCEKLQCTDKYEEDKLNHAERLLLNHGYLRDAIDTENNAYLESDTVKKILRKTFYGNEKVHQQTTLCFIVLAAVHMIALPLLMINMEARPLRWFYKKYKLHYMKVYIHMLGFLALLIAYANMLLFDYRVDGITYTDYFIMLWMASFFVDETTQIIVAVIRGKWNNYSIDWWNLLDWFMIALYTTGMLLKTGEGSGFQITSKLFLVVTFTALCTRLLHLTCMTEFLGRKLVINRKMIKDTSAFMIIITIIMLWYSVSFYALLYPNSEFSWKQMEKILRNGYWMLFGDLNIDATDLECSHNKTIYDRGILQRCPSDLGVYVTPYLKAFYGLLAVVLLLNLLIAMYSDTYTKVQQNANLSWLQMQIDLFEEYRIKTVFPKHLQLLALPGSILAVLWFCFSFLRNKYDNKEQSPKINDHPVFVRVFLYDTNYDIKSKLTDKAENEGVFRACEDEGKIDLSDSDAITTLNRLKTIEDSLQDMREKEDKRNQEVMQLLNEIADQFHLDKEHSLKTKTIPEEEIQKTEF